MSSIHIYASNVPYIVRSHGGILAESSGAMVLAEDGQSDRIFFPRADVAMAFFDPSDTIRNDGQIGALKYFHLADHSQQISDAAWCYEDPIDGFQKLIGYLTFDERKLIVEEF